METVNPQNGEYMTTNIQSTTPEEHKQRNMSFKATDSFIYILTEFLKIGTYSSKSELFRSAIKTQIKKDYPGLWKKLENEYIEKYVLNR